ncbi:MAG: HAD family hydrolase [Candidatus Helarchaeota archaeon]
MVIKLISFDFDGVIVSGFNTWFKIRTLRKIPDGRFPEYQKGILNGLEFRESEHVLFKEVKLCKQDFIDVAKILKLSPNIKKVAKLLNDEGYILIINSAAPKLSIETKLKIEGMNSFKYIYSMVPLFDENGMFYDTYIKFLDENKDFDKLQVLKEVSKREGIKLSEMIHVGDGINDIKAFKSCVGISYNAQNEKVRESAKYNINDLMEIITIVKEL